MALSTPIPDKLPETSEVKLFRSDTPSSNFDGFLSQYASLQQQADSEAAASRSAQAGAMRRGLNRRREIASRMPEAPRAPTEFREMPKPTERPVGDPMNVFKTFAPALAVLASFKARRPLVSSMNALASAMEGYQKGDMDVYNRERQIWNDNLDVALKENEQMIKRYDLIRNQYNDDMARMEVELRLAAKEMGDEKTIAALSSPGGAERALKRFEDMAKLQVQLQRAAGGGYRATNPRNAIFQRWSEQNPDATEDEMLEKWNEINKGQTAINKEKSLESMVDTATGLIDRIDYLSRGSGTLGLPMTGLPGQVQEGVEGATGMFIRGAESPTAELNANINLLRAELTTMSAKMGKDERENFYRAIGGEGVLESDEQLRTKLGVVRQLLEGRSKKKSNEPRYRRGDIISVNGKNYEALTDGDDPDVREVR